MAIDSVTVVGLREAQAAFKQLPPVTREAYTEIAVRPTASEIVRNAQARLVPGRGFQTGQLQRSLGFTVNRNGTARIGVRLGFDKFQPGRNGSALTSSGAFAHRPTKIGHLVEFGHGGPHPALPQPFMVPAVQAEQTPFLNRCRAAGKAIEERMANVGGRFL